MGDVGGGQRTRQAAFAIDDHNRVVFWSDGVARLLGIERKQALHRPLAEVLNVWDEFGNRYLVANEALHEMARRGERIRGFTVDVARCDGSPLRVFSSVEVVHPERNGSHQLLFRLRPDRRKQSAEWELRQVLEQALSDLGEPRPSPSSPKPAAGTKPRLSTRQKQVLDFLAQGMHCEHIGQELGLSVCTVRRHLQNAMEKLEAHTQAEAVAKSIRLGLI